MPLCRWLGSVFTRRPWRRRGLASALIGRSLALLQERGMTSAMLSVDVDNPTGALGLYEAAGFRVHDRFIALNSTLKAALELDASQAYAGSGYQYLEAVRHHGMLDAAPLDASAQTKTREDLANARARIDASKRDESLAQLFLERAASQIEHPDGSAPTPDEWRSARVILDQVLPAYFAARIAVAVPKGSSRQAVRMTLVRWPYT